MSSVEPTRGRRPTRRRVVFVNRVEDRVPSRVAYVIYRSRSSSQAGAMRAYSALSDWAHRRRTQLAAERAGPARAERDPAADQHEPQRPRSHDESSGADDTRSEREDGSERPDSSWTKGRIYEFARRLDLEGRSKMNKDELLHAVLVELDDRDGAPALPTTKSS